MTVANSIRCRIKNTIAGLLKEYAPKTLEEAGIQVPSLTWVSLQFCAKHPLSASALNYSARHGAIILRITGHFKLSYRTGILVPVRYRKTFKKMAQLPAKIDVSCDCNVYQTHEFFATSIGTKRYLRRNFWTASGRRWAATMQFLNCEYFR
jgi:hypothetical protein